MLMMPDLLRFSQARKYVLGSEPRPHPHPVARPCLAAFSNFETLLTSTTIFVNSIIAAPPPPKG
jgi:hypothetical protein